MQHFIDDQRNRTAVAGKIEQLKPRLGLGMVREKLTVAEGSTFTLNIIITNVKKLLDLLFVLFAYWMHLLSSNKQGRAPDSYAYKLSLFLHELTGTASIKARLFSRLAWNSVFEVVRIEI